MAYAAGWAALNKYSDDRCSNDGCSVCSTHHLANNITNSGSNDRAALNSAFLFALPGAGSTAIVHADFPSIHLPDRSPDTPGARSVSMLRARKFGVVMNPVVDSTARVSTLLRPCGGLHSAS